MSEKKYFKYINPLIAVVYAFPAKIKVLQASESEIGITDISADILEGESDFKEITEESGHILFFDYPKKHLKDKED